MMYDMVASCDWRAAGARTKRHQRPTGRLISVCSRLTKVQEGLNDSDRHDERCIKQSSGERTREPRLRPAARSNGRLRVVTSFTERLLGRSLACPYARPVVK